KAALRQRGAPALILCELSLPRSDGFALLTAARKLGAAPAVVVSAFPDLRDAASRLRRPLGITAVLAKSVAPSVVQRAVKRALAGEDHEEDEHREQPIVAAPRERLESMGLAPSRDDALLRDMAAEAARELGVGHSAVILLHGDGHWTPGATGAADMWPL